MEKSHSSYMNIAFLIGVDDIVMDYSSTRDIETME